MKKERNFYHDSHNPDARKQSALEHVHEFRNLKDALEVIDECRKQFRKYKQDHLAKSSFISASINGDFERMCEEEIEKNREFFTGEKSRDVMVDR